MPRIKAHVGEKNETQCMVYHKDSSFIYYRPPDTQLKHFGRFLTLRIGGKRSAVQIVLKGREINSLKKILEKVGELD